nr:SWIM zinc finger family protein [uncultured Desulfobulbus sp.]
MREITSILEQLTFADLEQWADDRVVDRGRSYLKRVSGLRHTPEGELVAWVSGTEDYATMVRLDADGMHSWFCTCPYSGGPCKHAVAVILLAARMVKEGRNIPELDEDDDLSLILFADDEEQWEEDPDPDELPSQASPPLAKTPDSKMQKLLAAKSKEELIELVMRLIKDDPRIAQSLREEEQLVRGQVDPLVRALRKEIHRLTNEPAWRNHWNQEESVPDYSHVERQFHALFDAQYYDHLLDLGDELWRMGTEQVEASDDDGETASTIIDCLKIVLKAVPLSSLPRHRQLAWVMERLLVDEFSLLEQGEEMIKESVFTPEDWREVASIFEARLAALESPKATDYSSSFRRGAVVDRLIDIYQRAGLAENIVPLLEQEVEKCHCYQELVTHLLNSGDRDNARQWCILGFTKTLQESPGLAAGLQDRLLAMAEEEKRSDLVAAHRAQKFFRHPSIDTYRELRKSCEKIKLWPEVRERVLLFLETGSRPDLPAKTGEAGDWPLVAAEVSYPVEKKGVLSFPLYSPLLDIAILERRMDDVVSLYERAKKGRFTWGLEEKVADAVAKTHPDLSLSLWRGKVDRLIAEVKPKAYREAAGYLRKMCKVYEANGRQLEWTALLAELRRQHKAKRRLVEILDSLAGGGKKIVSL